MLSDNIEYIMDQAGVIAVATWDSQSMMEVRSGVDCSKWAPIMVGVRDLLLKCDERSVRVVLKGHTVVACIEGQEMIAVVFPTGHPIAKSLRRAIRRAARTKRMNRISPRETAASTEAKTPVVADDQDRSGGGVW